MNDNLACSNRLAVQWGKAITAQRQVVADITQRPFTQQMLADAVGVSRQAVSMWESGTQLPAHCHIPKIARALHTTPAVLFSYEVAA